MDCSICVEKFNAGARARVECQKCHKVACKACVRQYLLSVFDDAGRCMFCNGAWDLDFMSTVLGTFIHTSLKDHRKAVMHSMEMQYMALTQPFVAHAIEVRRLKAEVEETRVKARALAPETKNKRRKTAGTDVLFERLDSAILARKVVHRRLRLLERRVATIGGVPRFLDQAAQAAAPAEQAVPEFVGRCPAGECLGFVASADFKCGLCHTATCKTCRAILAPGHACDAADVASVRAIAADSRPCPRCHAPIHRISGCDQMFCTVAGCVTAFSYATGVVVTDNIHNPHYVEYIRAHGDPRAGAAAGACAGFGTIYAALMLALKGVSSPVAIFLVDAARFAIEITDGLARLPPPVPPQWRNHAFRMKLMDPFFAKYGDEQFRRDLHKADKARRYAASLIGLKTMVRDVIQDTIRALMPKLDAARTVVSVACAAQREADADAADDAIRGLLAYANACLDDMRSRYQYTNSVPRVNVENTWTYRGAGDRIVWMKQ